MLTSSGLTGGVELLEAASLVVEVLDELVCVGGVELVADETLNELV